MNETELKQIIAGGESSTVEFKSWINAKSKKDRVNLAVPELVAFTNANGGTLFFGVEDNGDIAGCSNYDVQSLIEAIYDKTKPSLFVETEEIMCE